MDSAVRDRRRVLAVVGGLTALAAVIRFTTLDLQSYWSDEAVTVVCFFEPGLGDALSELPDSERTPPLYYVLGWLWAQLFGTGEVATRSLPALFGVAVVPVAYLAGARLVSRRTGMIAASIVAVHPLLAWYSQEARSYSLLVLMGGLSFLFFVRALDRPARADLAWWALTSALALATHYFALFLVAVEAGLLARRHGRTTLPWIAGPALVGLALLPLALAQSSAVDDFISDVGLGQRLRDLANSLLVGPAGAGTPLAGFLVALLVGVGAVLLLRYARGRERRGALLAGAVGIAAIVAPLLLAVVGADYFIARNVIVAVLPLAIAIAAGFAAAPRPALGTAAAGVLCALLAAIWVGVLADADRHRSDWRELARELGDPVATRALLVDADAGARSLGVYRPGVRALDAGGERIRELVIVGDTKVADDAPPSVDGLRLVQVGDLQELSFARYRSELPIRFKPAATLPGPQFDEEAKSLVEPAPGRRLADDLDPAFCRGDWGERKAMAVAEGP